MLSLLCKITQKFLFCKLPLYGIDLLSTARASSLCKDLVVLLFLFKLTHFAVKVSAFFEKVDTVLMVGLRTGFANYHIAIALA
jgi:hypothetical protein